MYIFACLPEWSVWTIGSYQQSACSCITVGAFSRNIKVFRILSAFFVIFNNVSGIWCTLPSEIIDANHRMSEIMTETDSKHNQSISFRVYSAPIYPLLFLISQNQAKFIISWAAHTAKSIPLPLDQRLCICICIHYFCCIVTIVVVFFAVSHRQLRV